MRMITFAVLSLMLIFVLIFSVLFISVTGAAGIVIFGDLIVCGLLIYWIIKKLVFKKKK